MIVFYDLSFSEDAKTDNVDVFFEINDGYDRSQYERNRVNKN